jgi:alkylation response protein AidB-like acyl-CoA dehydrogenase
MPSLNSRLGEQLFALADRADGDRTWPTQSWEILQNMGGLAWAIPTEFGGAGLAGLELLDKYQELARRCLTTCFILSQRDAACRRIRDCESAILRKMLLPPLARGESFATVGLSHLTTSHQHLQPPVLARESREGFILDGTIPWVTGAAEADHVVTGATLSDGRQILAVLPRSLPGFTVGPPMELAALAGSLTAQVHCHGVAVDRRWIFAGPAERVLAAGKGGPGGLETSCLALGLAGAAIDLLATEAAIRHDLQPITERLRGTWEHLWTDVESVLRDNPAPDAMAALRSRANSLSLRASQAALTASKGTGFLRPHPAQRYARQALFFLVWSCPRPAADATLALLASPANHDCS